MALRFRNRPIINGRKAVFEALEERIVMDAAVDPVPVGTQSLVGCLCHSQDLAGTFFGVGSTPEFLDYYTGVTQLDPQVDVPTDYLDDGGIFIPLNMAVAAPEVLGAQAVEKGLDVVLISSALQDVPGIIEAGIPEAKVVIFDAQQDNLNSLASLVSGMAEIYGRKIDNLAVASHGDPGVLWLGTEQVTSSTLDAHRGSLEVLASGLAPNAQIQLFGGDVAAVPEGKALVDGIAQLTGAQVFAGSNNSGTTANPWVLGYATNPESTQAVILNPVNSPAVTVEPVIRAAIGGSDIG